MMVMVGGTPRSVIHYWCGKYPGKIGVLLSPQAYRRGTNHIPDWCPYAVDNDAFSAWANKKSWDEAAWTRMLDLIRLEKHKPHWVLIPDVVADRTGTIANFDKYAPVAASLKRPLAFAVQDGMVPSDVPREANVVFVGGTTKWKWSTLPQWTKAFPRVHVGRVNELRRLLICDSLGVESVDGTGWMKKTINGRMARHLQMWLDGFKDSQLNIPDLS